MPEQPLQFYAESGNVEQVGSGGQVDQQVDVTRSVVLAAHHASEHPNIGDVVVESEIEDRITMAEQDSAER